MAFPIIPKKRSGATGSPTSLTVGELAVNTATGELFLGGDSAVLLLNPPTAAGTTTTERTGDGTATAFTFTGYNGNADGGYLVSVGGIDQPPSKYAVTNTAGGTITFVEAPTDGELISIRALVASGGGGGGSGTVTSITAGDGLDGGTITESGTISLAAVTTAQSNVGSGTQIPVLSINDKGQVTALATVAFAGLTTSQIAGLSTTAPAALATSAVVGLSTFAARADHQHVFPSAADVGALGATASAGGDLTGTYPNPTLAAITTAQSNVGSSTMVPVLSIDAKGRVTSLTTAAISGGSTNATQLQGVDIATTAPTNGQNLTYNSATQKWEPVSAPYFANLLLVAGGGGGGSFGSGGGGGGGCISQTTLFTSGTSYSVTVGAGGAGKTGPALVSGDSGSNSEIVSIIALGGGGGATFDTNGIAGGSGGGAGQENTTGGTQLGGAGTVGQGNNGGNGVRGPGSPGNSYNAGGGGGAGAAGANATITPNAGGNGGAGVASAISGTSYFYAGGGGGAQAAGVGGVGGNGGSGGGGGGAGGTGGSGGTGGTANGGDGISGTAGGGGNGGSNTGGGGGGTIVSSNVAGGNGGSGVVVISYAGGQRGTGGTVTSVGGNTIHTFTSSGTYVA